MCAEEREHRSSHAEVIKSFMQNDVCPLFWDAHCAAVQDLFQDA